jgi:hypothetical protein
VFLPRSGVAADRGPGRIRTRDTRSRAPSRPTAFVR